MTGRLRAFETTTSLMRKFAAALGIASLVSGCAQFAQLVPPLTQLAPLKPFGVSILEDFGAWLPRWAALHEQGDVDKTLELYFFDATWLGPDSKTPIHGTEALRVYLQRLHAAVTERKASCSPAFVTRPAENMAIVAGQCQLSWMSASQPRAARAAGNYQVTMALVRTGGQWRIASQHLSVVP